MDLLDPQSLWSRVKNVSAAALASGALEPISTAVETIPDGGIRFTVRVLERLQQKIDHTLEQRRTRTDPFLPPDPALVVGDVSDTHVAVLNKFNVLDDHLLVVTREFRSQEEPLDERDLAALAACMAAGPALGFYNGGEKAGASQPHKHLQVVPLPLGEGPEPSPVDAVLPVPAPRGAVSTLRFRHALAPLSPSEATDGTALLSLSRALLAEVGVAPTGQPYNLLVTPRWMMAVPRPVERWERVSVNALGFAGSLLVPDRERLEKVRRAGPMAVLVAATGGDASPPGALRDAARASG